LTELPVARWKRATVLKKERARGVNIPPMHVIEYGTSALFNCMRK
jgi:hypothetical protein